MKNTVSLVLCLSAATASAQKMSSSGVPAAVTQTFASAFAGATGVRWEREKGGDYEAEFVQKKQAMSATFDASGKLKETEREIAVADLPAGVLRYLRDHKLNGKVTEAAELKLPDGSVRYEAEVKKKDLIFDAAGNLISSGAD